jgi:hypothetical protein
MCVFEWCRAGVLDENAGEDIPALLWDADTRTRKAAVQFVYEDSFAEDAGSFAAPLFACPRCGAVVSIEPCLMMSDCGGGLCCDGLRCLLSD